MSDKPGDYGILLNNNIKLHRMWFKQATRLLGINCIYKAPKSGKHYNIHGDLMANYEPGVVVGCFFHEHPDQKSMKKLGWNAELQQGSSLIEVPYDLKNLQAGALFIIPSGIDNAEGRVFRVLSLQNGMVFPASITCEIAPEYEDIDESNKFNDFRDENLSLLRDAEGDD